MNWKKYFYLNTFAHLSLILSLSLSLSLTHTLTHSPSFSLCLSVCLSLSLSHTHSLSQYIYIYISVCLSVCISIYLSLWVGREKLVNFTIIWFFTRIIHVLFRESEWWGKATGFNCEHAGLWHCWRQVWTPVTILHSISVEYFFGTVSTPLSPGYRLNSASTALHVWFKHKIIHKSWYAIKQRNEI